MVAGTHYFGLVTTWFCDCFWWGICLGAIHLYSILIALDKRNQNQTILVITLGFLIIFIVFGYDWTFWISVLVGVGSMLSARFRAGTVWLWAKLALVLSMVIPNIVLSLVFYLILTPLALLSRKGNKRLQSFKKNNASSFFEQTSKTYSKEDFKKIW